MPQCHSCSLIPSTIPQSNNANLRAFINICKQCILTHNVYSLWSALFIGNFGKRILKKNPTSFLVVFVYWELCKCLILQLCWRGKCSSSTSSFISCSSTAHSEMANTLSSFRKKISLYLNSQLNRGQRQNKKNKQISLIRTQLLVALFLDIWPQLKNRTNIPKLNYRSKKNISLVYCIIN